MGSTSGLLAGILVGVYFGVNMLKVPTRNDTDQVASLTRKYNITSMRLHDPILVILDAFVGDKNARFTFDIPNTLLKDMNDNSKVENWFNKFVKPYISFINLEYIVVGEDGHNNILRTMKVLRGLLNANTLNKVKLTTIVSYESLVTKDPPSNGAFHPNIKNNLRDVLLYLVEQGSPELMVNVYPFKKYVYENGGKISIDFATFGGKESIPDGSFIYRNLFDYMVDTIYVAIEKLRDKKLNDVTLVIGETGWPTAGHGADSTVTLARTYNQKLIAHMSSGKGTPRKPNINMKGFIRSLFNEDTRPQGESQHYGIFNRNFIPVYPLFRPIINMNNAYL